MLEPDYALRPSTERGSRVNVGNKWQRILTGMRHYNEKISEQTYIRVATDFQDGGERTGSLSYWSAETGKILKMAACKWRDSTGRHTHSSSEMDAKIDGLVVT